LRKARERGIAVITWDADAEPDARDYFVNQATPEGIGTTLVDEAATLMGGTGSFAIITGALAAPNQNAWIAVIRQRLAEAHPGMTLVTIRPSDDDRDKAFAEAQTIMRVHPDVTLIMAIAAPAVPGAAEAVKQANRGGDVKLLSEVAGTPIQDVFLGSCMTNIGHFRAAAEIWRGQKFNPEVRTWICPPTRMDQQQLKDEALFSIYSAIGARIEIAGCSLCMGNQARVPAGVNMFSTSTRNFDDRIGDGAKVYLGSAELGAVITNTGKIPTPKEYLQVYKEKIEPKKDAIYKYLQFDEMAEYK
jgi:homoaconitase/3-isopropylmalate dehydratase large subunit